MKLGAIILDETSLLNDLKPKNQAEIIPGETAVVIFQLIDQLKVSSDSKWGQRYIPASGATLEATIKSLNSANTIVKGATQPFPDDKSIWQFTLTSAETQSMGGINMTLTLTEGASVRKALMNNVIIVAPQSPYQC